MLKLKEFEKNYKSNLSSYSFELLTDLSRVFIY